MLNVRKTPQIHSESTSFNQLFTFNMFTSFILLITRDDTQLKFVYFLYTINYKG